MRRLLLAWILALPCATGVAAAPLEPFPEDHHGCVQAFLGTVIQMDVREAPRGPSDDRFFYTEAVVAVDSVLAGIPADTLRVVTGHSLRFHPDGFLDGYQEDGSGLVWFRTGDHVLIASPLLPESGVADATQPFLASFSRLFERPFTGGDQPARIIVGYSLAPLLEGEAPARLLGDAEALLNRVGVETVESGETLEQLVHAVAEFSKKRCGTRLFETEGQVVARKHTYTVPDARLRGVAVRPDGDWVLVDEARHTVGILSRRGDVLFQWGGNGSGDGQFSRPQDAAVDASGDIYVTDPGNHRIQRFNFGGTYRSRWGSEGTGKDQFLEPSRIAVGPDSAVYVLDGERARVVVFDRRGNLLRAWGESGTGPGQLSTPLGIDVAPDGDVYITDSEQRVQRFSGAGAYRAGWGARGSGPGEFNGPADLCVDSLGRILVADTYNYRVQAFHSDGTLVAMWGADGWGNAPLWYPRGIATTREGDILVVSENTLRVFAPLSAN